VKLTPIDFRAALAIAAEHRIYAYDTYFLECAIKLRAPLLTLDRSMARTARSLAIPLMELER
jgi:predicted nucleic acid-binding protein